MSVVKSKTSTTSKKKKSQNQSFFKQAKSVSGKSGKALRYATGYASPEEFSSLKDISGYNKEELAALLGITHRTIQNKKANGELFDIAHTERLRKLNQLFKEGNEIFTNKDQFKEWLQKPSYGLDYDIPAELIKKPGGIDKVVNELRSIKYGDTI